MPGQNTQTDKEITGVENYRRLLRHAMKYWKVFIAAIISMAVVAATSTAFAALMKPLMDDSFVERDPETIKYLPLVLIGIYLIRAVAMFVSMYGMSWIGRTIILELRNEMFHKLVALPKGFYDKSTTGEIISKFSFNVEQVATASTSAITVVVRDSLTAVGLLGWMFYLNPVLAGIFITVGPFIAALVIYVSKRFRVISHRIQGSMGDVSRVIEEAVKAHLVVKIFGGKGYEVQQFETANQINRRQNLKMTLTSALSTPIVQLIIACALAGIIYIATQADEQSQVSVGTFTSFMIAMFMLFAPIRQLTSINAEFQKGIAAAETIFEFIDMPAELDTGSYQSPRVKGVIEFENVVFKYSESAETALTNINIKVSAGQTVAFVGRSGSGKSTLLNLLPRFYDLDAGEIRLDERDVRDYTLASLREQIAYVGQDVILFNDTIEHNIAYGALGAVSHDDVVRAATSAHALEFIERMSGGFEAMVGERGVMLSGGQRQRIAIARALLKDAPVLILDEATSALDTESEKYIQDSLEMLMKNRTTLVIAHRLSTIEKADLIVVMDQGHIVEAGTHAELLALNSHYAALHSMQFSEPDPVKNG